MSELEVIIQAARDCWACGISLGEMSLASSRRGYNGSEHQKLMDTIINEYVRLDMELIAEMNQHGDLVNLYNGNSHGEHWS